MRTLLYLGVAAVLLLPRIATADEGPRPDRPHPKAMPNKPDKDHDRSFDRDDFPGPGPSRHFHQRRDDAPCPPADRPERGPRSFADRPERGPHPWWMDDDRPGYADAPHRRPGESRWHDGPPGPMAYGMQRARGLFDRMDRDDDGKLSFREFAAGMAILHQAKRGDGPREPMAGRPPMRRPGEGHGPWDEGRGEWGPPGPHRPWGPMAHGGPSGKGRPGKEIFRRMDKNDDGKISKSEASERLGRHFDKVDRDADGYVTRGEMKEAMAALARRLQEKRDAEKK